MGTGGILHTPFGATDASLEARDPAPFVVLPKLAAHAQLTAPQGDALARVIVGRAGAGKSRYLLALRERLEDGDDCEIAPHDFNSPSLALISRLAEWIRIRPVAERTEVWRKLWKRAIIRSAACHLLAAPAGDEETSALETLLRPYAGELLPASLTPSQISLECDRILRENDSLQELMGFLNHGGWHEVDQAVSAALAARPKPLCFFLDVVEEESAPAPLYWLWCMKGLLGQVIRFIRDSYAEEKLRIFVGIREQTWIELRNLAKTSLENHPNVRILSWDAPVLLDFFADKIRLLPEDYHLEEITAEATSQDVVATWLGMEEIPNSVHALDEPIAKYILRHTRLIPRDIVCVGNFLAGEVFAARHQGEGVAAERIHAAVADAARTSAAEELQWCALEMISARMAGADTREERQKIMPDEEAPSRIAATLGNLLGFCSDVIEEAEFASIEREANDRLDQKLDLGALLWRHGLIGFGVSAEGPFQFSYDSRLSGRDALPPAGTHVAMHPALIDAYGVRPGTNRPIYPFPEDQL